MSRTTRIADRPHRRLAVCLLLYVATGMGSVALTAGREAIAPLYLAAGVAVACVLAWGPRMVWAIAAGCALVELQARLAAGQGLTPQLLGPMAITALGAALQAGLAGLACRRWLAEGPALERPRDILGMLLLAGPLACTVNATLSVGAMVLRGELAPPLAAATWLDWWYGDVIGVLIGAPMTLTLIGRPAALWRTRRLWVGVPMLVVTVLTVSLLRQQQLWDQERGAQALARDGAGVLQQARRTLQQHLQAMDSLWLLQQDAGVRPDPRFAAMAAHWQAALPAVGAFSIDVRTTPEPTAGAGAPESLRVSEVHARPHGAASAPVHAERSDVHHAMRGRDVLGQPALRATWARALGERQAAASPGLPMPEGRAVVVYRPLLAPATASASVPSPTGVASADAARGAMPAGTPPDAPTRPAADGDVVGALVMVLETDALLRSLLADAPAGLQACLSDLGLERSQTLRHSLSDAARSATTTLAGPPDCGRTRPWQALTHQRLELPFAGRSWELAVWRDPAAAAQATPVDPRGRLLAAGALLLAAGVGVLQLLLTGHTRRLQAATDEARDGHARAEAAIQAHVAFLSRVSHELRTPLHAMLGLAALLRVDRHHPPDAWQLRMLQQMDQSGQALLQAIDQLLRTAGAQPEAQDPASPTHRPPSGRDDTGTGRGHGSAGRVT